MILAGASLGYANGGNDVSKGIATLIGSGVTTGAAQACRRHHPGAGGRVTKVLAKDVTPMNNREGFAANLVTAALVTTGALHGLPMSTTHVASGGIFGAGAQRGALNPVALRSILLAWVFTLPAAAGLGACVYSASVVLWG